MIEFKIFRIHINIDFYFIIMCFILLLGSLFDFSISIILSIIHELGHILFMKIYKIRINRINITPFSVDIIHNSSFIPYKKEIIILLFGPLINIFLSLLFFVLYTLSPNQNLFKYISIQSLLIGFINLIPISSLDGGRILLIWLKNHFDIEDAEKISFIVSIIFIIPLMTSGFLILFKSNFNISILLLSIYLCYFLILQKWN